MKELSMEYGISVGNISDIVHNKMWKDKDYNENYGNKQKEMEGFL